jgi:formate dehydrogenase subunit beta
LVDLEKLRTVAKETISRDDVKYLIGWRQGTYGFRVTPCFIKEPGEAEQLIFSPLCTNNLASYLIVMEKLPLPRGEKPDTRKVAVMVKGCDSRAVVQQNRRRCNKGFSLASSSITVVPPMPPAD